MVFKRRVFDLEIEIWEDFLRSIERIVLVEGSKDRVIWVPSSSERLTCSSFKRTIARRMWHRTDGRSCGICKFS